MQTLLGFLSALKKNNNREWFEANKEKYLKAKTELEGVVEALIVGISKFDKTISSADLKPKDCVLEYIRM